MTTPTPALSGRPGPVEAADHDQLESVPGHRANRSSRRTFTAEFKRALVQEYDAAPNGTKGAILRRERLYDSHLAEWRTALNSGSLGKKPAAPRGRPKTTAEQAQINQLLKDLAAERAAHERTRGQLASSDAALDVLGKGVAFLEALSSKNASSPTPATSRGKQQPSPS